MSTVRLHVTVLSAVAVLVAAFTTVSASAQVVKLTPKSVDPKGVEDGTEPMITPSAAFMDSPEKLGVDPAQLQLEENASITSVTVGDRQVWIGVTTTADGTRQYSLAGKDVVTQVKDGPPTTWSRTYTAFTVPQGDGTSVPLRVRATGNPASVLRYFIPQYMEGTWKPGDSAIYKVAVLQGTDGERLLLDLDGDGSFRFKSPTLEVRSLNEPFKLQGETYQASTADDGATLAFEPSDATDAPELSVLRFGAPAPDWAAIDFDGKPVKLSDFRGKFVFFDVWATWCGPCLGEIPHIQEAQEKYGDKVHIIGVSIDSDIEKPKTMVADKKLTYKQFWASNEFQSEICKQYQVNGIPATFLVDPEGNLVVSGLRGDSITKALEMASMYDTPEAKQYFAQATELAKTMSKVTSYMDAGNKSEAISLLKETKLRHKDPEGLKRIELYLDYLEK